jgi:hypothetical protein
VIRRLLAVVALSGVFGLTGQAACGTGLRAFDEVNSPADDAALARCRAAARAALPDGRKPTEAEAQAAWRIYDECADDAGLP